MDSGGDRWSIDKLNHNNYQTWKFQIKHLLKAKDLYNIVDGSETAPAAAAEANVKARYQQRYNMAFSTIVLSVSTELLYLITDTEEPTTAWKKLQNHFERNTLANKLFLKKKYFRTVMKEGTPISNHLKYMKDLTGKLSAIGAAISEEDQVVTLLGSLPDSYDTLVTALEARVDDLTLEFVHQSLINEEQKRKENQHSVAKSSDAALVSQRRQNYTHRKPITCYKCQKQGHIKSQCPENKRTHSTYQHKAKHAATTSTSVDEEVDSEENAFVGSINKTSDFLSTWLIDSGASRHMTPYRSMFIEYEKLDKPEKVGLGDGRTVDATGVGKVKVALKINHNKVEPGILHEVLHVPQLATNLFSVRSATERGRIIQFGHTRCWIKDKRGKVKAMGTLRDKLFHLDCDSFINESAAVAMDIWHQRLAHLNETTLKKLHNGDSVKGINISTTELPFCVGCAEGKPTKQPSKPIGEIRSTRKLELIHSDVCSMENESLAGSKYFVTFIDDYSRCCAVYFMKNKSEVLEKLKTFQSDTANCGQRIGTLRSDRGGEYTSEEFVNYLKSHHIRQELTAAYNPQQNGVAERMNRTLCESARAMMHHAKLPKKFWAEAIATSAYVRNRVLTSAHKDNRTPYEKWYGRKPDISNLRVFGCIAYALIPQQLRQKLDKKSHKVRFVGYCKRSKAYRVLDETTGRVIIRRDVIFDECNFGHKSVELTDEIDVEIGTSDTDENPTTVNSITPRRSERKIKSPLRYGWDEYADTAVEHLCCRAEEIMEPQSFDEAKNSPHAKEWMAAMQQEHQSLIDNKTWELVELPADRKAIGCKWIFKVKYRADGEIERFKSRLVARGFSQQPGVDYEETFSPVVSFTSIRMLLAYALQHNMVIHQMDVKTAFLNGELQEEIYMTQPEGYANQENPNLVCKLNRAIYGLKQASRCWNHTLDNYLRELGFTKTNADQCVYIRNRAEMRSIIAVYVDDLIIISDTLEEINSIKGMLSNRFEMTDLGQLHYCLGITITYGESSLLLDQSHYIQQVLNRYGMNNCNPVSTPSDLNTKLVKDDGQSKTVDANLYRAIVGSLLYISIATRPDIANAVGVVSRFNSSPNQQHMTAVKRIMRYLKGTIDMKLKYMMSSDNLITGYADADWAGDQDTRKSTSGNVFMYARGPISWMSKRQTIIATSTAEAEYISLFHATQESVTLQRLLHDIDNQEDRAITLYTDNQAAISIGKNLSSKTRTKHIDIKFHYVREAVANKNINIEYCPSIEMIADILTKPINRDQYQYLRKKMGIIIP